MSDPTNNRAHSATPNRAGGPTDLSRKGNPKLPLSSQPEALIPLREEEQAALNEALAKLENLTIPYRRGAYTFSKGNGRIWFEQQQEDE